MGYPSVDRLQQVLSEKVFHYAKDSKKAAGRALGTLVEIITFYTLKSWGLERHVAIERPLPEFANEAITHNVEYSLHPATPIMSVSFTRADLPITTRKMAGTGDVAALGIDVKSVKPRALLTRDLVVRNSCMFCECGATFVNAYLEDFGAEGGRYALVSLRRRPFAVFECKRVGVEEGVRKGPQTIEKAKQGAYVARTVSALQRIRLTDGSLGGLIQRRDGSFRHGNYYQLMAEIIASEDPEFLSNFILTVGVVSNHGNWFTSGNHNKELKVLAQSYDWLLFLSDDGIAQFIDELLLHPSGALNGARNAFLASYTGRRGGKRFTKVQMALDADRTLQAYFQSRLRMIEGWYNIIAPVGKRLAVLKDEIHTLKNKNWGAIHT